MSESNFKWAIAENIMIYLIVAILFWLTRSGWVFLFLIFVNARIRPTQRAVDGANVCPDCETTSNMYRCESCGCQWSPRN